MTRTFQRTHHGKSTYTCKSCGKLTRETGDGEQGVQMCRECFHISSQENSHADNHSGRMADCAECREYLTGERITLDNADRWCDSK